MGRVRDRTEDILRTSFSRTLIRVRCCSPTFPHGEGLRCLSFASPARGGGSADPEGFYTVIEHSTAVQTPIPCFAGTSTTR